MMARFRIFLFGNNLPSIPPNQLQIYLDQVELPRTKQESLMPPSILYSPFAPRGLSRSIIENGFFKAKQDAKAKWISSQKAVCEELTGQRTAAFLEETNSPLQTELPRDLAGVVISYIKRSKKR